MMKKKYWFLSAIVVFIIIVFSIIYLSYFSKPTAFPNEDELMEKINSTFSRANVNRIQDTLFLDDKHVFVPFISSEDNYGLSFWEWKRGKWRIVRINTDGEPLIWKINRKAPSSYHFIWNIPPENKLSNMKFFLMKDRNFQVYGRKASYFPKIQMEKIVPYENISYGTLQLPSEWTAFMESEIKLESAKQPSLALVDITHGSNIIFKWIAYDDSNQQIYPEFPNRSASFSTGNGEIDFVIGADKRELESVKE